MAQHQDYPHFTSQQALGFLPVVQQDLEAALEERRKLEDWLTRYTTFWHRVTVLVILLLLPPLGLWYLTHLREQIAETRHGLLHFDRRIATIRQHLLVVAFQVELAELHDEAFLGRSFLHRSFRAQRSMLPQPHQNRLDGRAVWSFAPDDPEPVTFTASL